jgi:Cu/Ag efflux pump CusA
MLVAGGAWSLASINVDAFPDLTPNQVQVITVAAGLSPNEVENLVSFPMETSMMGLPRTRGVRSISKAGISVVTVSYEDEWTCICARACSSGCRMRREPPGSRPNWGRDPMARSISTSSSPIRCR